MQAYKTYTATALTYTSQFQDRRRRQIPGQYGLYVPDWILSMVLAENDLRKKIHNARLSRWLYKTYPGMPPEDMAEIQKCVFSSSAETLTAKPNIKEYVLSRYTAFDSLRSSFHQQSTLIEEKFRAGFLMARQEADEIEKVWRGE